MTSYIIRIDYDDDGHPLQFNRIRIFCRYVGTGFIIILIIIIVTSIY